MYPGSQLTSLAERKAAVRRRIAARRDESVRHFDAAVRPITWLDRGLAWWRQLSPLARFAAGPLGFWALRRARPARGWPGHLLRWAPALWRLGRLFTHGRPSAGR